MPSNLPLFYNKIQIIHISFEFYFNFNGKSEVESDLENMEVNDQCSKHDGNHGKQLDQEVDGRT